MPDFTPFNRGARTPGRRRVLGLVLCVLCGALAAGPTPARSERDDGQRALAAREGGRILPLETLTAQIAAIVPGRLLEVELDDDDGLVVYELRWQLADGRRLEIEVDARDGRWLKLKGARLESVFRKPSTAEAPPRGASR